MVAAVCLLPLLPAERLVAQEQTFSLDGLIVTASPTARSETSVANHVTVLGGDELRAGGARSLSDALRNVPGVGVVRGGSFGAVTSVFLRGGESDHTLVMIDGVQVNQAGGGFDFAGLTLDNVERVEIVRGPGSALYGSDAVAGVIHVITRTGRGAPRLGLSFDGGSFGRQDWAADFLAGTDRAGYSVSIARRSTDGSLAFNNEHVNTVVSGSARFLPDDETKVSVGVRVTDRVFHFPTDGSGVAVDRNSFTFSDETVASAALERNLGRIFSIDALLALAETDGGTDDAPDGPDDSVGFYAFKSFDHFRRAAAELRGHARLGSTVLTAGVEVEEERQRSFTESLSDFGPSNGSSENDRQNQGYYAHGTGTASLLSWNLGARVEDNERFGRFVSWQAGASVQLPGASIPRLRASVGRGIKEPTFFENFATGFAVGNPDLDPERSLGWEIGLEQSILSGAVALDATWFDQTYDDLIQYTAAPPVTGGPNFFNVAGASSRGMEIDLTGTVNGFVLGGGWHWLDTRVTDAGFDSGAGASFVEGESLLRRAGNTVSLRAGFSGASVDLTTTLTITGERSDRDFTTFPATPVVLDAYRLLTVGGELRLHDGGAGRPTFALQLRAENLLDVSYEEAFGFQAPGRGLYAGVRVGFGGGG